MPSLSHHTDSAESPPAPVDPNGDPLSERIASGRPTSSKTRSIAPLTPAHVGSTIRTSSRYRLAASVSVRGSQRVPSAVRNQPLKSIDHSSLGALAGDITSPWAIARRRRGRSWIRPLRFKMSPMVEAAGHSTFGASSSSHALIFFGPKCGNRRRTAMMRSATRPDVAWGQFAVAWLSSSNQRASPLPAPLPNVERLTANALPPAQLADRENARLVLPQQRDTLFHRTGLLERHRSSPRIER